MSGILLSFGGNIHCEEASSLVCLELVLFHLHFSLVYRDASRSVSLGVSRVLPFASDLSLHPRTSSPH